MKLQELLDQRKELYSTISEFAQLTQQIQMIKTNQLSAMKTMVNLGSEIYVQARVPDTSRIFVHVGIGFHVEFTLDEALAFIKVKEEDLERYVDIGWLTVFVYVLANEIFFGSKINVLSREISKVKADMRLVSSRLQIFLVFLHME